MVVTWLGRTVCRLRWFLEKECPFTGQRDSLGILPLPSLQWLEHCVDGCLGSFYVGGNLVLRVTSRMHMKHKKPQGNGIVLCFFRSHLFPLSARLTLSNCRGGHTGKFRYLWAWPSCLRQHLYLLSLIERP